MAVKKLQPNDERKVPKGKRTPAEAAKEPQKPKPQPVAPWLPI